MITIEPIHLSVLISLFGLCNSLYGCHSGGILSNMFGGFGGYPGAFGNYGGLGQCGTNSLFYHWTCCDYNAYDCCIELETWVIVLLVIFICGIFICLLVCIAGCIWSYSRNNR